MNLNYADVFIHIQPDFFDQPHIRSLPPEHIFDEQVLALADYDPQALDIPVPEHITYGLFAGDFAALKAAVAEVNDSWVPFYNPGDRVFCAFDGEKVVSFCLLDDFGEYQGLKIGAPGCVGTIPAYRKQGIGLRMIQLATAIFKEEGYDLSWIHYTAVGHWYAKLGYRTVVKWNCEGVVSK